MIKEARYVDDALNGPIHEPQPIALKATRSKEALLKGKCAFGPFLSILVIECQHKCLNVNLCPWMNDSRLEGG
jgi:hypothetical protein